MTEETDPRPAGLARREMLVGGLLLATAAAAFVRTPRAHAAALGADQLEKLVPQRFGPWAFETSSGLILPPPDQLQDKIYSQLVTRQYRRSDGTAVMLLIAYSDRQDGAIQVHRPEVCYPASGLTIRSSQAYALPLSDTRTVPARLMVASGQMRDEELVYWTRIGRYFPDAWAGSHWAVMRENLVGRIPDGVLVRISCNAGPEAGPLLTQFATSLVAASGPRLRRALIG